MKRNIFLALSLALASGTAFAQKLSPNAEILLLNKGDKSMAKAYGNSVLADSVEAFVRVKDAKAAEDINGLGAVVLSKISDRLITALIPFNALRQVAELENVEYVQAATKVKLLMDKARADANVDKIGSDESLSQYTGKGVVVGIVDNGFEYGHIDFYNADGSEYRIKRVWDQNARLGASKYPDGFSYGVEYTTEKEILAKRYDMTDTYHGTHVTGIAAGGDTSKPYHGVAPEADIVLVSTSMTNRGIVDGVKYIFNYAKSVGKPCVVNLSLGGHIGPHDGTSDTDEAFDEMTGPGRIIVGAAGNEGGDKLHASKVLTESDNQLKTMIGYASAYEPYGYLDVWGSKGKAMKLKCVVTDNNGNVKWESDEYSSESATSRTININQDESGTSGRFSVSIETNPNNNRPHALLSYQQSGSTTARKLAIIATGEAGDTLSVWNNTGTLTNNRRPKWTDGDTKYTVGEIGGTGNSVISAGSYNTKLSWTDANGGSYSYYSALGQLHGKSSFSSMGPTLDGRVKPDVAAPGAVIVSAGSKYYQGYENGTIVDNSRSAIDNKQYYYVTSVGTSMASPFVTGTVALWLQANPNLTPAEVRNIIAQSSRSDTYTSSKLPDNKWGAGKIDAYEGLLLATQPTGINDTQTSEQLFRLSTDPSDNSITVQFAENSGSAKLAVYNSTGMKIAEKEINGSGDKLVLGAVVHGVYVLKVTNGSASQTFKAAF